MDFPELIFFKYLFLTRVRRNSAVGLYLFFLLPRSIWLFFLFIWFCHIIVPFLSRPWMHRECTADNGGGAAVATPLLPRLCCSCGGCSGREHRDGPLSGGGRMRRVRGGSEHKRGNTATTQLSRTGHSLSAAPPRRSSSSLLEEPACRSSIVPPQSGSWAFAFPCSVQGQWRNS